MTKVYNRSERKQVRRRLRKSMPSAEIILWSRLKNRQLLGERFRRQYGIDQYVIDFYCPSLRLAIEVDGDTHFETASAQVKDRERQASIEGHGVRVVRFTNLEIFSRLDEVLRTLADVISELRSQKRTIDPLCSDNGGRNISPLRTGGEKKVQGN